MTSKEAFEEIIKVCNYYHRQISKFDCETVCGYPIKKIERDLEVLEILKSSIVYDERKIEKHKFMNLSATIFGDDNINKIKEWLENE